MMKIASVWAVSCGLVWLGSLAQAGAEKKPFQHTPDEMKVFELTNVERKLKELPPLKLSVTLSKIARAHSDNMAWQGKMEHKLDDKTPGDRSRAAGYAFKMVGENIGAGDDGTTMPMIMKAWMDSPGHRENMLFADYTEIGVGIGRDKEGKLYFTQLFAIPRKK